MRQMRQVQLRGLLDDFAGVFGAVDEACFTAASAQMAPIDRDINDVIDNWKPTGLYTPAQMRQILLFGLETIGKASGAVNAGIRELQLEGHRALLNKAHEDLQDQTLTNPMPFISGVQQAEAQFKSTGQEVVIDAPGFKRWVVNVLKKSRAARFITTRVQCARPNVLFGVLSALDSAVKTFISTVKAVAGVVASAAKAAGAAILKIPDILSSFFTFLKVVPWVTLAFVGYYAAVKTGVVPPKYDPLKLRERQTFKPWRKLPPGG